MNNGTQAHDDDDGSPWTQPRFLASAVVVGLVVILGIVLAVAGGKGDGANASREPGAVRPAAVTPASDSCALPAGDQDVPTNTPGDTEWELVGKVIAPVSRDTYGPARDDDGFRTCFAHSPMGALYATVNFWATLTAKPPSETYRRLARESPARATSIKNDRDKDAPSLGGMQVNGFRFASYDDERATVKLAFRVDNGRLLELTATMLWTEDDWRYEVPLDQRPPGGPIQDLTEFVSWRGV